MEVPRVFLAQGNATSKQAKFHGIAADRRALVLDLDPFDQTQHHEPLNLRIHCVNEIYDALLTAFQGRQGVTVDSHKRL